MTKFRNKSVSVIRNWNLDIVWDLACLRDLPTPAKRGLRVGGSRFGEGRCLEIGAFGA